jgi:hypothetical protein
MSVLHFVRKKDVSIIQKFFFFEEENISIICDKEDKQSKEILMMKMVEMRVMMTMMMVR